MRIIKQYNTIQDREILISENPTLLLIEEQNISDGNFLVFSDEPIPAPKIYVNIPEEDLNNLKNRTTATEDALLAFMMGGV